MDTLTSPAAPPAEAIHVAHLQVAASACATCHAPLAGPFCAACGQPVQPRITLRGVVTQAATGVVDLDRGFLHTLLGLSTRPGRVIRDYLEGRTVPYTGPVRYFVILATAVVVVFLKLDLASVSIDVPAVPDTGGSLPPGMERTINDWLMAHLNLLMAATVPFTAAGSRWMFRRAGYNYAEHLVVNLYVAAQQGVIFIALALAGWAAGRPGAALVAYGLLNFVYYVWAARQTFRVSLRSAILRGVGVQMVNMAMGGLVGIAVGVVMAFLEHG